MRIHDNEFSIMKVFIAVLNLSTLHSVLCLRTYFGVNMQKVHLRQKMTQEKRTLLRLNEQKRRLAFVYAHPSNHLCYSLSENMLHLIYQYFS